MVGMRKMEMIVKLALVALVASSMWVVSNAQSYGSSNSCTNVLIGMSPCLNYITGNSSNPSSSCCTQLEGVVKNNPQCLCQVVSGGASNLAGIAINQTQALNLPKACKVDTPPASRCSSGGATPSGSSAGATPTTDSTTPNVGGGSKATPTTEEGSSDANKIMSTGIPLVLALFVVAFSAL